MLEGWCSIDVPETSHRKARQVKSSAVSCLMPLSFVVVRLVVGNRALQRQYLPTRPSIMYLRIYTPRCFCIIMYIGGVSIGRILVYFRQLSSPSRTRAGVCHEVFFE
jgi:Ni/Fe-hydrogenase subunit HybB-like protein